jgi:F-type H+-transporting ATPase subunit b
VELNWSTFILEIINFLILIWILKRFLYKPVMDAIAARRSGIEREMHAASEIEAQAQSLKGQYERRMEDWEREKQSAREQLHAEIDQERTRLNAQLQKTLQLEQQKAKVLAEQQEQERQHHYEQLALQNSMRFTSKLLGELAGAELEARLLERLLRQLQALPATQRDRLNQALSSGDLSAQVLTAFPLSDSQREQLQQALQGLSQHPLRCSFGRDTNLLAGARIELGPWLLQANLQDELQAFAEFEHNSPLPLAHE